MTMRTVPPADMQLDALIESSVALALSLIGRSTWCGGTICTGCHQQAIAGMEINHVPSCLVGKVLAAVAFCEELRRAAPGKKQPRSVRGG